MPDLPASSRPAALDPLAVEIGSYAHDPLGFVLFAFPWGEAGTVIEKETGPEPWQRDVLGQIGSSLAGASDAVRIAVASGHGVGKSALVAWVIVWALATFRDTRGVVTANTAAQLRTKTWPELTKWLRLAVCADWFEITATAIASVEPVHERTWRIDAVPWNLRSTEAFAGLHNQGRRLFVAFDEASAIPDLVWETIEGALTDRDTEILWLATGNPTRNTGRFRECFGRFRHRWQRHQVDGRKVSLTDRNEIARWAADYGDDSDFFRVRVKGEFPRGGALQFIDGETVDEATRRPAESHLRQPLIMGVDCARGGDDQSAIWFRRGLDARTIPAIKLRVRDLMVLAGKVAEQAVRHRAAAVFIDEGGIGAGVVDRVRQMLPGFLVVGINFGSRADRYTLGDGMPLTANKAAEMWASMREWLRTGAIPDDPELKGELTGREYGFNLHNAIQLERKEDMKKRGLSSPDNADGLALTFAYPVADLPGETRFEMNGGTGTPAAFTIQSDYDPLADF
jgi:hypothetical protein